MTSLSEGGVAGLTGERATDRSEGQVAGQTGGRATSLSEGRVADLTGERATDLSERRTASLSRSRASCARFIFFLPAARAEGCGHPRASCAPSPFCAPGFEMSLLESAVSLINSCEHSPEVTVLAGAAQEEAFRSHIDGMDTGGARVRLSSEPVSRNTAPAITLGAMRALDLAGEEDDEDADVVVAALPSDHFVGDNKEFKRALSAAVSAAKKGFIAVIGVQPTRPETGYGYIKRGAAAGAGVFNVGGFTEKPDAETAAGYVEDGFLWNCGIFVFRARVMIDEIKKHAPKFSPQYAARFQSRIPTAFPTGNVTFARRTFPLTMRLWRRRIWARLFPPVLSGAMSARGGRFMTFLKRGRGAMLSRGMRLLRTLKTVLCLRAAVAWSPRAG